MVRTSLKKLGDPLAAHFDLCPLVGMVDKEVLKTFAAKRPSSTLGGGINLNRIATIIIQMS